MSTMPFVALSSSDILNILITVAFVTFVSCQDVTILVFMKHIIIVLPFYWHRRVSRISGSLIWVKILMELIFNLCGKFQWSSVGPISQIHSPHLHIGAPVIFSDFLRSVELLKRESVWVRKATGSYRTYSSLVKVQTWFLSLRWKTCLQQNCIPMFLRFQWMTYLWTEHMMMITIIIVVIIYYNRYEGICETDFYPCTLRMKIHKGREWMKERRKERMKEQKMYGGRTFWSIWDMPHPTHSFFFMKGKVGIGSLSQNLRFGDGSDVGLHSRNFHSHKQYKMDWYKDLFCCLPNYKSRIIIMWQNYTL